VVVTNSDFGIDTTPVVTTLHLWQSAHTHIVRWGAAGVYHGPI